MELVDLRSDTVSHPTPSMREAMANAAVGDDVYGEDPTINHLQRISADMLGKESALFVPSGTMGNLAAILAHCRRGDEVILGNKAHTFLYEAGGISALGGVHSHQLMNQSDGTLALDDIKAAIRPDDPHDPITRLITLENTQNQCGGIPLSVDYTHAVGNLAREHGLKFHLDGARIFNAAAALDVKPRDLCTPVDSVTFCLSKGLCAPVGSVLCGSEDFIYRAHRARKQLGGGMRQAGILAAAGIVALEEIVPRLKEDHQRAKRLADGLKKISWIELDPGTPYTNMIFFNLADGFPLTAAKVVQQLAKRGVLVGDVTERRFRLVTHYWITDDAIDKALSEFNQLDNV
jgi:threonine aldolase